MEDIKDRVIDYLLTGTDDICGKCVYYLGTCDHNCRQGLVAYFKEKEQPKTLGAIVYQKRKARGWTQQDLAEKLNTVRDIVSKWENDRVSPQLSTLINLADLFGCTIDELVGRDKHGKA